ncbi:hypothetical protein CAT67_11525 [Acinetobacter baumannii]|uniref:beta family protein n=1 Tax=Acinetobacter baumannii TaxID=470 RepID=UPI000A3D1F72|nr:beta family protein [Acinetobacter baumannii]MDV7635160.1 beta family protein [Acinetobacter baumannii]OTU00153.1 hypothetical protein CAT67_11525 [Acinetobacter baumannii]
MKFSYMPILKALPSEITALSHLNEQDLNGVIPLMDFSLVKDPVKDKDKIPKRLQSSTALIEDQLVEICDNLSAVLANKYALIDNYRWQPNSKIETGELVISKIIHSLIENKVKVIPVIGYDRWESEPYKQFFKTVHFEGAPFYCLRLDRTAIEDSEDPEFFLEMIEKILDDLVLPVDKVVILIDAGSIFSLDEDTVLDDFERVINVLAPRGFKNFITAGCSLPATIDKAAEKDQTNILPRKEMTSWQYLRRSYDNLNIIYGDYGVKPAESAEGPAGIGGKANAKIRYTIDKAFYIVRGHMVKGEGKSKEKQIWGLAKKVVDSSHYMGEDYSFGDKRIKLCSEKKFNGGHPEWIVNDTCHHVVYSMDEIRSYDISLGNKNYFSI